jgi:hypothetical protein
MICVPRRLVPHEARQIGVTCLTIHGRAGSAVEKTIARRSRSRGEWTRARDGHKKAGRKIDLVMSAPK